MRRAWLTYIAALLINSMIGICYAQYSPGACHAVPDSKKCMDATPCKDIGGKIACLAGAAAPGGAVTMPQSCWQYSYDFACTSQTINTCTPFENNQACTIVGSECTDKIPETGQCSVYTDTYQCQIRAEKTAQKIDCASGLFDDSTLPKPVQGNSSFSKAAIAAELIREAQTYNNGTNNLFSGVSESCKKGYMGIKNCCKSTPGAKSNAAMTGMAVGAAASTAKYIGSVAIDKASTFVYDAMYANDIWTSGMAKALMENDVTTFSTNFASKGLSLGAYGFTWTTNIAAQGTGFMGGNTVLFSSANGSSGLIFNPYVFAAMVAIQVIQNLASCSQSEQMLALHKGANLSTFIVEECTKKVPITKTCIEWTSRYCSFNSVLAKIVNTQGKPQLSLPIADCRGLSTDQLSRIDFSKIDFSEFSSSIVNRAKATAPTQIKESYTPIMQSTTEGSAQSINQTVLPNYSQP